MIPPACADYITRLYQPQWQKTISFCNKLEEGFDNCVFVNYFEDTIFKDSDFFDADHLNHNGAQKLSKDLNTYLIKN